MGMLFALSLLCVAQLTFWQTGIMGYTPEAVPYVGAVHGKPGAFISAGHSGHGQWSSSLAFELCYRTVG